MFDKIVDIENLKEAHRNARKGKSWYDEVKEVDKNTEYYLRKLQQQLKAKTYQTSEYEKFIKNDSGKEREIFKLPYYPDRICQWAIIQVIEPYLLKTITIDTYSAIPNRGIHFGLKRLNEDLKDKEGTKYCLKLDVRKFYPSIDHRILKKIYRKIFKDPELLWLLDEIIDSTEGSVGIPIGNYLSQWSGNIYLAYFDRWIKEVKKEKYFHRYMDDIVILNSSKEHLHRLRKEIDYYLKKKLNLEIKDNWQVFPTRVRGVDFLGYRSFGNYVLLRKTTSKNFKSKMLSILKAKKPLSNHQYMSIKSYEGWLKWCNSYNLKQTYIKPLEPKIEQYERRKNIK